MQRDPIVKLFMKLTVPKNTLRDTHKSSKVRKTPLRKLLSEWVPFYRMKIVSNKLLSFPQLLRKLSSVAQGQKIIEEVTMKARKAVFFD